jgi:hypothetical protein
MPAAASAQVTMNSVRIGAADTVAIAKFYEAAFGMQSQSHRGARRSEAANFGATAEAAKANKGAIVIMHREWSW